VTLRSRDLRRALGLLLAALLPSCGGSSTGPERVPTPVPTLQPFVVFDVVFTDLVPGEMGMGEFTLSAPGAVRAEMDWTSASNQMYLFVMAGLTCGFDEFEVYLTSGSSPQCALLGSDTDPATKPAVITFANSTATGARVFVLNLGPTAEAGTIRITLQR
jgi:hypothetical protein